MNAYEQLVDEVGCRLVIPRRDTRRALDALKEGRTDDVRRLLREMQTLITSLEDDVRSRVARITCECPACGDIHRKASS